MIHGRLKLLKRTERRAHPHFDRYFSANGRDRDGLLLDVFYDDALIWSEIFADGDGTISALFAVADEAVIVIARGYVVHARWPDVWRILPAYTIDDCVEYAGEAVFAASQNLLFRIRGADDIAAADFEADGIGGLAVRDRQITGWADLVPGDRTPFAYDVADVRFQPIASDHP